MFFLIYSGFCHGQSFSKSQLYQNDHSFDVNHFQHFKDSSRFVLYLPSFRFGLSQKGPKITDYISRNENGVLLIDPNAALPFAEEQNIVQSGGRLNGFGLAFKLNPNVSIAASYGVSYISHIDYPLQALNLYTAGNAFIFGQQLDLSFKSTAQAFHSYTLASNYHKDRWTIGVSLSALSGIGDISVDRDKLLLEVAPLFYNLTTDTDFNINTTDLLQYESLERIIIDYSGELQKSFFSSNRGFSFSISAQYELNPDTDIRIGISDIGRIKWQSNPFNYGTSGIRTFDGVNLLDLINPDNTVSYQDSIEQLLDISESQRSYETKLPISYNLGVQHVINEDFSISGSVNYNSFSSFSNYAVGVAGHYSINDKISSTASVHHSTLKPISVGLGGSIRFNMFDLFAYTNDISSILNQIDAEYTYGSLGINLNFGILKQRRDTL